MRRTPQCVRPFVRCYQIFTAVDSIVVDAFAVDPLAVDDRRNLLDDINC